MGKKTGPSAPDPARAAAVQGDMNIRAAERQAQLNRINEITPLGSVRFERQFDQDAFQNALRQFEQDLGLTMHGRPAPLSAFNPADVNRIAAARGIVRPDKGDFERITRITELDPTTREAFDQQQELARQLSNLALGQVGRIERTLGEDLDLSGLPRLPGVDDFGAERRRVEDALFRLGNRRLQSNFDRRRDQLETQLANQGIPLGSEAFRDRFQIFNEAQNDAVQNLIDRSTLAGGVEQSRLFGLGLQGRQQGLQELMLQRNQPINDVAALLSGSQVQIPNFGPVAQVGVAPPDFLGAQQMALNQGNFRAQQNAGLLNSLFGLGGQLGSAAILASDRRLKKNIRFIGKLPNGLNAYRFSYLWGGDHVGVMADEVKQIKPEAVITVDGIDFVDYSKVL